MFGVFGPLVVQRGGPQVYCFEQGKTSQVAKHDRRVVKFEASHGREHPGATGRGGQIIGSSRFCLTGGAGWQDIHAEHAQLFRGFGS